LAGIFSVLNVNLGILFVLKKDTDAETKSARLSFLCFPTLGFVISKSHCRDSG